MNKLYIARRSLLKAVLLIGLTAAGTAIWTGTRQEEMQVIVGEDRESEAVRADPEEESGTETEKWLGVHVSGAVRNPDAVYYLKEGDRVADAVEAAGGALDTADLSRLNLAGYVQDGQKIYVPEYGETSWESENTGAENQETPLTNINLATKIELLELPGIGETYAQRIIDYREAYGPFERIEDIMNVKGIGESKFEDLKNRITVR